MGWGMNTGNKHTSKLDLYTAVLDTVFKLASHAGVFRGARISSLPTNACSTEDNIPFPLLHSRGK